MKNYALSLATDCFLTFFIGVFATFLLLSPLKIDLVFKLLISITFSLSISLLVFFAKKKNINAKLLKIKNQKEKENLLLALEIMPIAQVLNFFNTLLLNAKISAVKEDEMLIFEQTACLFDFSCVTERKCFCNKIKKVSQPKILFFCNQLSKDCDQILAFIDKKIKVISGEEVYLLAQKFSADFPKIKYSTKLKAKQRLKKLAIKIFTKKRALGFAFFCAILLLFSPFSFYPRYYKFCAIVMLFLCFVCLIFGKSEKTHNDSDNPFEVL